MLVTKLKSAAVVGLVLLAAGADAPVAAKDKSGTDPAAAKPRVDPHGEPLPMHALLRIGTTRLQHEGQALGVAASEDGRFLASYGGDSRVRVWDAKDGRPVWTFELRSWEPWALAFSRNGKELAAVSKSSARQGPNGAFRRWDLTTGKEMPNGRDHPALDIRSVYFTYQVALACRDDGRFLAAETAEDGQFRGDKSDKADIILYSPDVPMSGKTLKGHTGRVMSVSFTKDAKTLVSLGDDGMIRFWNTAAGKEIAKVRLPPMKDHGLKGNSAVIAISPDGKNLAVSLPDQSTRLLDAAGRELRRLPSSLQMNALAFSSDGKALITCGNLVESWNVANAKPISIVGEPRDPLRALSLSPDGKTAAFTNNRDRLRLADLGSGRILFDRELPCRGGIAFSPSGRYLAVAPGDKTIAMWDVAMLRATEKPLRSEPAALLHCKGTVNAFVFSPDGKRVATVEEREFARIYETASKQATLTIEPGVRRVYGVAFSADGKLIATTAERPFFRPGEERELTPQCVGLWDSFTGKALSMGEDLRQLAHTVAFHPNGKSLVAIHLPVIAKTPFSGSAIDRNPNQIPVEDRMETIRIWDVGSAREMIRFEDPVQRKNAEHGASWVIGRSQAVAAAISPDGWLFAAPGPGGIVVFETASGRPRLRLRGHLKEIAALAFTPDGNTLVSASSDSTLLVWDVTGLRTGTRLPGQSEDHWAALADADTEKAGRAIFAMVDAPAESVAWLRKHLKPDSMSQALLQKLATDLGDPKFAVREQAMRELAALGPVAEKTLTKRLKDVPSAEASRRIKELLAGMKSMRPPPDQLRAIRAVEVLDRIGSREANDILRELAGGFEGAYLTRYARESLDRTSRRLVKEPARTRAP